MYYPRIINKKKFENEIEDVLYDNKIIIEKIKILKICLSCSNESILILSNSLKI